MRRGVHTAYDTGQGVTEPKCKVRAMNVTINDVRDIKGRSLPYTLYLDLRPGSPGGHRVTEVFLTWSLGHSTKFAVPQSQSTNMDEVVREHGEVHHRLSSNTS